MFGGNGTRALDWADFIADCPLKNDAFVLIEYPGYGFCKGSASPKSIEESAEKAVSLVGNNLHLAQTDLESRLNIAAHSIGCGAALNFAVQHSPGKVVLIAPFTTLRDMARRVVGMPLCYLLLSNFDNRTRIRELAASPRPPAITIFHGAEDTIIPERMGRELALISPKITRFESVPDADHNDVVSAARFRIFGTMDRERE
ncbi:MAG: alpha/beta hydrolase [Chthoniobacteraceae bacterium]|nr:alpha/beta hydrolase [Chthoniobacteraceae bacterium]